MNQSSVPVIRKLLQDRKLHKLEAQAFESRIQEAKRIAIAEAEIQQAAENARRFSRLKELEKEKFFLS